MAALEIATTATTVTAPKTAATTYSKTCLIQ